MFGRYSVETKVVKEPRRKRTAAVEPSVVEDNTPCWIEKIEQKDVVHAAVGLTAVYAAIVSINTLSTVIINYAPKN